MNILAASVIGLSVIAIFAFALGKAAGLHDEPVKSNGEKGDLLEGDEPCAWCQMEAAIKAQPHQSHTICNRHKQAMLEDSKRFPKSVHA